MTHKERMIKRRDNQNKRQSQVRVKTGRYTPRIEDEKHNLWIDAAARLAGTPTESLS